MARHSNSNSNAKVFALAIGLFALAETGSCFSSSRLRIGRMPTPRSTFDIPLKPQNQRDRKQRVILPLHMQLPGRNEENQQQLSLSAYNSGLVEYDTSRTPTVPSSSFLESFLLPVSMASMMVTGNTVGAGMLVMPEVAAGPGPMLTFCVMIGTWIVCLTSGLTIAQVAIQEHETSGSEVPSSFKEFAEATLPSASNMVSGTSVFINTLVVAFDVFKAGQIGHSLLPSDLPLDGMMLSYIYSGILVVLVSTQSLTNLSRVSSTLVVGLFATFAGLLLPGLANVPDPLAVTSLPPLLPPEEIADGILRMTPVVISVLVFQNIVPTITRLLDYDRAKIGTALVFGSFIPLLMYMAWIATVLGGGIDVNSASGPSVGGLLTCFSLITVAGSSLGTSMSLSEEFEILLGSYSLNNGSICEADDRGKDDTFSLPSVAMPIGIALITAQIFSSDITETLKIAGAFGSPILYGLIPVSMALIQQRQANKNGNFGTEIPISPESTNIRNLSIIPGGITGLGALALGSVALIGAELFQTCSTRGMM
mmetsp:Transcript_15645/g.36052  ORF Transcript_15645/g.36052 Transcript_15645/m.36052 type:complete len:537 (-) Transcript_15645:241-1851(-)